MWSKVNESILPIAVIGCLLIFLVPLPGAMMDCLLVANIAVGLLVLLTTLYVRTPLDFSVFPTVLLATTLARLVLNVATTRLILTRADRVGMSAAGDVVRQFGQYVSGDQLLVGLIIFAIIFIIQMLVITKGATRISEVAARFALDGVPGRQLAIDADLSAGAIDQAEARRRREEVNRQADFYGAMDGASKFIRGDAVAGVVITGINILGGLFVGVVQGSMRVTDAAEIYTKLTIGDGLVSQIPALLISLSAGLLVTRGSEKTNLPVEFLRQLFSKPEVLTIAGCFLALLTFTQLPTIPLLLMAAACLIAAYTHRQFVSTVVTSPTPIAASGATPHAAAVAPSQRPKSAKQSPAKTRRVEDFLQVDPVSLELGRNLVRLATRSGDLLDRITRLREFVAGDLGVILPSVRVRDNLALPENHYRIRFLGNVVGEGEIPKDGQVIVPPPGTKTRQLPRATTFSHPGVSSHAKLIAFDQLEEARALGCQFVSASQLISRHLQATAYSHAHELLTRDATQQLVDELRKTSPAVVAELIPGGLKLGQVQQVLQGLLREGVPIRQLATIFETLCDEGSQAQNLAQMIDSVRHRLARTIVDRFSNKDGCLQVITIDPDLEATLVEQSIEQMDISQRRAIRKQLVQSLQRFDSEHATPVVLTRSKLRRRVLELTQGVSREIGRLPGSGASSAVELRQPLAVLSHDDLPPDTTVRAIGIIDYPLSEGPVHPS